MKVLLIEPPFSERQVHVKGFGLAEPLALEVLAGYLRHHDVRILDMRIDPDLEKMLALFQPDVVGAGCYATGLYAAKALFRRIKKACPAALTIVGGHHAALIPEDFSDPAIDFISVGEGEWTLRDLVDTVARKGDLREVAGLMVRQADGQLQRTARRELLNLEEAALPDRRLVDHYRRHYFRGAWRPIYSLSTERGCPYRCHFCSMWKVNEGKYRVRSAESVVDEIASLEGSFIDFIDDNTFHDVKRAHRMYDLIKERGIRKSYKAYARSDTVAKNPDLIAKWREIGLKIVLIGFESCREKDLQFYGKKNTIENNEKALKILQDNGVEVAAYFVVNPDYTREDFRDLNAYVQKWNLTQPIFTVLTPLPGTEFYRDVQSRLLTPNYEYYDFFHSVLPTTLPLHEFQHEFYKLWKNAYSFGNLLKKIGRGGVFLSLPLILGFREFMNDLKALTSPDVTFRQIPD